MRSSFAEVAVVVAFGLAVAACGPTAYLVTEQDPAQMPQKQDPVFVTVPNNSTIPERQLLPVLKLRMIAEHFDVVDNVQSAKWILGISHSSDSFITGYSSKGVAITIGGIAVGKSKTTVNYETDAQFYLSLFSAKDFLAGKREAIWTGSAKADRDVFNEYATTIMDDLLAAYGTNYEDERMMRFQDHPE